MSALYARVTLKGELYTVTFSHDDKFEERKIYAGSVHRDEVYSADGALRWGCRCLGSSIMLRDSTARPLPEYERSG